MTRVVLENVSKSFPQPRGIPHVPAVQNVSLTLPPEEVLALVGPSGCGKTTLLRLIAGLESPDAGQLSLDGLTARAFAAQDHGVALVFQNLALYPHLTVGENLVSGLLWRRRSTAEIRGRLQELSRVLSLNDCLDRRPEHLSGGQRQRVALGRALALQPRLLLLDEPFAGLDTPLRAQLRQEIRLLQHSLRFTLLYVTHDHAEALSLGDRVAVMRQGTLEQCAAPRVLYLQPANQFVAHFMGAPPMNFWSGQIVRAAHQWYFRETASAPSAPVFSAELSQDWVAALNPTEGLNLVLGLRPEHLNLAADPPATPQLQALVNHTEYRGAETLLHLRTASSHIILRHPDPPAVAPGTLVALGFRWEHAHFFDATGSRPRR